MCNCTSGAQMCELPQTHCGDNMKDILFPWLHIYHTHLASARFEHSVCHGSLIATYITLLALLVGHCLVHWYRKCITVHQVPKCISCHKAIVVITERTYCFHNCIYIMPTLFLLDLSTLCVVNYLWPIILRSLLCLLSTLWLIGTNKV